MKLIAHILVFTSLIANGGCGKSQSQPVDIGSVQFSCNLASAQECDSSGTGKTVHIGLVESSTPCTTLMNAAGANFYSQFSASGSTIALWDGTSALTGTVSTWVDSSNNSVTALPEGTYRVCAFLDFNGNGILDTDEPFFSQLLNLSPIQQISTWQAYDPGLPPAAVGQSSQDHPFFIRIQSSQTR